MSGTSRRSRTRTSRQDAAELASASPSPLDPFLRQLLTWAATEPSGFSQSAVGSAAEAFGWQPAFADAVFTSARVRGLIGPYYGRRGRSLWQLSRRGRSWLEANQASSD